MCGVDRVNMGSGLARPGPRKCTAKNTLFFWQATRAGPGRHAFATPRGFFHRLPRNEHTTYCPHVPCCSPLYSVTCQNLNLRRRAYRHRRGRDRHKQACLGPGTAWGPRRARGQGGIFLEAVGGAAISEVWVATAPVSVGLWRWQEPAFLCRNQKVVLSEPLVNSPPFVQTFLWDSISSVMGKICHICLSTFATPERASPCQCHRRLVPNRHNFEPAACLERLSPAVCFIVSHLLLANHPAPN